MSYAHGRVLDVQIVKFGSELSADTAAGAMTLVVEDAADFDESGGFLVVNEQIVEYTTYDDETGTITLAAALAADADEGDRVDTYDVTYGAITTEKIAYVRVDGEQDDADPVEAMVAHHLVTKLDEGIRGTVGESVLLEPDGDEWRVVDVLGFGDPDTPGPGSATKFWDLDTFTVSVTGDQVCILTFEPTPGSLHMGWNGLWQPHTDFTCSGRTVAIPDPDGVIAEGDVLDFRYAYSAGVTIDNPPAVGGASDPVYIGNSSIDDSSCAIVPYPAEALPGDLLVLAFTHFSFNGDAGPFYVEDVDPRFTVIASWTPDATPNRAIVAYAVATEDTANITLGGNPGGDAMIAVYRDVEYGGHANSINSIGGMTGVTPVISGAYNAIAVVMGSGPFGGGSCSLPTGYTLDDGTDGGQGKIQVGHWIGPGTPTSTPSGTYTGGGTISACCVIEVH